MITVFPTKKSALLLVHPNYGPMTEAGVSWPLDLFTSRRLADGSITKDEPKAESKDEPKPGPKVEAAKIDATKLDAAKLDAPKSDSK